MKSKTITILFITSIVFNLLLVGYLAGNYTRSGDFFDKPQELAPPWLKWIPEQQRRRIERNFRGGRHENRELKNDMQKHHMLVIETITETNFNPSKLKQQLKEQRQRVFQLQEKGDEKLVKKISGMPLEKRLDFSERLRVRKPHRSPPPRHDRN